MIEVEHVIGDEKYDWETLSVVMIESIMLVGRVCCDFLSGFVLCVLYLYLWYSHIISVSKGCIRETISWLLWAFLWYCSHNHFSLVVSMVVRYLPVLSYICVNSPCVCMVLFVVVISFSGLHSVATI